MILECLDGPFRRVDAVITRLDKLPLASLRFQEFLEGPCRLVVGDIKCGFVPFIFELLKYLLECLYNGGIGYILDWEGEDIIRIIVLCHKIILIAVDGADW